MEPNNLTETPVWLKIAGLLVTGAGAGFGFPAIFRAINDKRKAPSEIELNRAQTQKTTVDMLGSIMQDLNDSFETQTRMREEMEQMRITIQHYAARDAEFAVLEAQVARARAAGFLDRDAKGGTGPNPAA